jgi:hypothetical protein
MMSGVGHAGGPDVIERTGAYERWLAEHMLVVTADFDTKHREMAGSPMRFLRGSYYLWLESVCTRPHLQRAPQVPIVGDLHIENFGTWRDRSGVRRWGVNDLDEIARGSYAVDLVRLAVSAVLAPHVALSGHDIVDILLTEWCAAEGGTALDLDDDSAHHLRQLVPDRPHKQYFERLASLPVIDPDDAGIPAAVQEAVAATTSDGWHPTWHRRTAGTGSLGHPRFGAFGLDDAAIAQAREVKLLGPATQLWVEDVSAGAAYPVPTSDPAVFDLVTDAVAGPHPYERRDGWQVRRLSPDDVRIELTGLAAKDSTRLLRSMARATANVHAVDPGGLAESQHDANTVGTGWFTDAVQEMTELTRVGFAAFVDEFGHDL